MYSWHNFETMHLLLLGELLIEGWSPGGYSSTDLRMLPIFSARETALLGQYCSRQHFWPNISACSQQLSS